MCTRHGSLERAALGIALGVIAPRAAAAAGVRVSDVADVFNVRANQLRGVGLVVGLNGTGDQSKATRQLLASLYARFGVNVESRDLNAKNVAAVAVTATLPPFLRGGARLDAIVSSIGDATSLDGGTLLMTPLVGADNEVYAVAEGALSVGGYLASGQAASVQKNHPTAGRLLNGVLVEKEVPMRPVSPSNGIDLVLRSPNFVTARRLADAVNARFAASAVALDGGTVRVHVPRELPGGEITGFLGDILSLTIEPEEIARVVVNARTGTIVAGEHVVIRPVAITHGNLNVTVSETPVASQPAPFSDGKTQVLPRSEVNANEENRALLVVPGGVSVKEVAETLNSLGVTPRDLIEIFDTLKEAGALHAELTIL